MNKRRYQSTAVNQVDWAALGQAASGRTVTFSVDVAKTNFMADWMLPGYETVQIIRWRHPQETPLLVAGLRRLVPTVRIEVVMEPSGTYGDSLRYTLGQLGLPIYRVAPQRVHDAAEVFDGVPSLHDAKSAYLIGRLHQEGASTPWQALSAERRDAQACSPNSTSTGRNSSATTTAWQPSWPATGRRPKGSLALMGSVC